ncbi:MAG: rRNA pseudouridine synthase [Myxococcales bacterium]|nr:rRNA pseudouridine synthase [Myxococcales bacterium]
MQLHRALSKLGLCSRKVAARWVAEGRVRVRGVVVRDPLVWVALGDDAIAVERGVDEPPAALGPPVGTRVYALHKPRGVVTTRADERGRRNVHELLPPDAAGGWLFPVGRLDRDSEGLLLFTDDGVLADALTDPRRHVPKTYRVRLDRALDPAEQARLVAGVELDGRMTAPAALTWERGHWYRVVLREGRNRQLRRMFALGGRKVERLVRVEVGPVALGDLAVGAGRWLSPAERAALRAAAGLTPRDEPPVECG